ncbi:MAG: AAA family ATPase [Chlorobiaceae bacterium]|nr:AAA family ATPase [Chlorobiaceae bacterium]
MTPVAEALCRPEAYPHTVETPIRMVETHISMIFLTGRYAYKLKKPVNLGFLDFSTLERRSHCCREELRLNRRLCPGLYLDVLPVTADGDGFRIGGTGPVADYVVRMVQFDRSLELDRLLAGGALPSEKVREIAGMVSEFHRTATPAEPSSAFGTPEVLLVPMLENLDRTENLTHTPEESVAIETIRAWTIAEHRGLAPVLRRRRADGYVRECHGDMHTGNMVVWNGKVMIFDCIEFNPNLSVIDVMSDAAFLFMDLQHSCRPALAWTFLNGYLSDSGDYGGLRVLRLYCAYRSMVRAKVTAIRLMQESDPESRSAMLEEHRSYLSLALGYVRPAPPVLVLMHGVSGSGKSVLAAGLSERGGFVHLRSDIERKRLFGISPLKGSRLSGIDIYSPVATEKTYRSLLDAAESAISGSWPVIVDATFLRQSQRRPFIEMAGRMGCLCRILCLTAPDELLRERVLARLAEGADPSEADPAVLDAQLRSVEPPEEWERALCVSVDTKGPIDCAALLGALAG